jgi:hypothetical protein
VLDAYKSKLVAERVGQFDVKSRAGGLALDVVRAPHLPLTPFKPLPPDQPGEDNDLKDKVDAAVVRVYALGERWGPEKNKPDQYFRFKPGNGIHDIHMNQGNVEAKYKKFNGVFQDGGLIFQYPGDKWPAIYIAFQWPEFPNRRQDGQRRGWSGGRRRWWRGRASRRRWWWRRSWARATPARRGKVSSARCTYSSGQPYLPKRPQLVTLRYSEGPLVPSQRPDESRILRAMDERSFAGAQDDRLASIARVRAHHPAPAHCSPLDRRAGGWLACLSACTGHAGHFLSLCAKNGASYETDRGCAVAVGVSDSRPFGASARRR